MEYLIVVKFKSNSHISPKGSDVVLQFKTYEVLHIKKKMWYDCQ